MVQLQMSLMHTLFRDCLTGIPDAVTHAAREEGIPPRDLARAITGGKVVIPANPRREHRAVAIGEGCRIKVNVNVGTSGVRCDPAFEVEKARAALTNGADTLMDLSTGGDLREMRRSILAFDVPVGTVPVYEAVRRAGNALDLGSDLLFRVIREHCADGVDFLTLHCGVNRAAVEALRADPRVLGVVSRGGSFHAARILATGEENPLFAEFDYLLEILSEFDVVASLGDGMRPGSLVDAPRRAKTVEYLTLGDCARRAQEAGVQRMVEGPGHIPLDAIPHNVRVIRELTDDAPLYLLGPLVTDIAPGYDHVTGAIGGAVAAMHGADFLCMVSPAEHLALPSVNDIIEGTRVARIAAHVGDTVRKHAGHYLARDARMADARRRLDWDEQFSLSLFGENAKVIHERDGPTETCSMCGDLCALTLLRDLLDRKQP